MKRTLLTLAFAALVCSAIAAPPPGGPGPFSDWYRSLKSPVTGLSCCDEGDCRPAAGMRMVRSGEDEDGLAVWNYEVLITPETHEGAAEPMWVPVDRERILPRDNPTNSAIVCWRPYAGAMCLVLPGLT